MITAQQILSQTARDVQAQLGPEHPALLDYVSRIQLEILKLSHWRFLLSAPQRFLTREGITDYWIGPTGTGTSNTYDTGLNISNLQTVRKGQVFDRSNFRELAPTAEPPDMTMLAYRDSLSRLGPPRLWRNAPDTPSVLNLYPAPDNQNDYRPVPAVPVLSTVAGGSLSARTYQVQATLVDAAGGESLPCPAVSLFIPAGALLTVQPPAVGFPASATGIAYSTYNLYASAVGSTVTRQTSVPLSTSAAWTEPTTGLITGASLPTESAIAPLGGYIIEFRYFQSRQAVTSTAQTLQIPDDYQDVLTAGVNALAFQLIGALNPTYLSQAGVWAEEYAALKTGMIRDANMFPRGGEFIHPDSTSITTTANSNAVLDELINHV